MIRAHERTIRFGLNYTPSKKWYYCWSEWDAASIREDFAAMQALGIDHIRLQLIWPMFQPNTGYISATHLNRLREMMAMAADAGFDVLVTLLTGWLSGYFFLPPGIERKTVFTGKSSIEAERRYVRAIAEALADCDNLMGFDLGNEINCINHHLDPATGDAWAAQMISQVRQYAPEGSLIVNGVDHTPWIMGSTFSLDHLCTSYDAISIHAWPYFSGCLEKGLLDGLESLYLSAFFSQLAQLYRTNATIPIWIQEFGACDLWGSAIERETYMRKSIEYALDAGVTIFTWWCSHDKTRELNFSEFEYHYGLFSAENVAKPLARTFRDAISDFAAGTRRSSKATDCLIVIPDSFGPAKTRDLPEADWMEQNLASTIWSIYEPFLEAVKAKKHPAFVRESSTLSNPGHIELIRVF